MSYYTYFYPTEEHINSLKEEVERDEKNKRIGSGFSLDPRKELLYITLKEPKDFDNPNYVNFTFHTRYLLLQIAEEKRKDLRKYVLNELNECKKEPKYFYLCGNYTRDFDDYSIPTDELVDSTIEKLNILHNVIKHPNFFDESEKFYTLQNEISSVIEGFDECVYDSVTNELIEKYEDVMKGEYENEKFRKELGLDKEDEDEDLQ